MQSFPVPPREKERLRELKALRAGEWEMRAALDEICAIAARLLGAPIAFLSLVARKQQFFAGKIGLESDRTPRQIAFCSHTIMTSDPLIVQDATRDTRFCENPLVTQSPNIRSYLGIPLETAPGLCVGALCVVDSKPRAFTEGEIQTMTQLAGIAVLVLKSHRAKLELDEQLSSAIELQKQMLPSQAVIDGIEAACPLEVASCYKARDGVGGDIWGIEATGPHRLLLYIADFTGHGLAAALNTARFHSFVHIASRRTDKPASMLRRLNERLHQVLPAGQFATMFCATFDFGAETLEYASAGAPPQLYRRSFGDPFEFLEKPGLPLGIMGSAVFESVTVPLLPGGALVLYTDGLIETPRPPDAIFTPGSLRDLLNAFPGWSAAEISNKITGALFFDPAIELEDDLTLIVAKHTGERIEAWADYEI